MTAGSAGFATGSSLGLGASLGAVDWRSMLAQVFCAPAEGALGFAADVAAAGAVADGVSVAVVDSQAGALSPHAPVSSGFALSHSDDSSVGTES